MTKKTYLFLAAAALVMAACSNDDEPSVPSADGRVAVNFSGGITLTRATADAWEAGDGIGIYMLESGTLAPVDNATNRRYVSTAGDGKFTPATEDQTIYFPLDENNKVDFIAYYPQATLTGNTYEVDVTNQSNPAAIDLLWSNNATARDKTVQAVDLSFAHRLSRIEVELIAGTGVSESELTGTTIVLTGQPVKADFDVLQNTLTPATDEADITLLAAADGLSASAIILPQEGITGRTLGFMLADGTQLTWPIENDRTFEQAMETIFRITVNRIAVGSTEVEVTASIEPWGVQGTVEGDLEIQ